MEPSLKQKNIALTSYFYLSVLIFIYVVWRSFSVGFTHDESLSYNTITGDLGQMYTANNHWLNTVLMFLSSKIFGFSEFALRLPNVIAFGFYLFFIWQIFAITCKNPWSLIIAIPLFLFNPFMLDFFGLARGYGLGMAFFTGTIYYFLTFFQQKQSIKNLLIIVICSICCVYSNYSFLTAILAIHGTALIYHFKIHREKIIQISLFYLLEGILLIPAVLNILYLGKKNELYVGGDNNVFRDTVKSILNFSFSFSDDQYNMTMISAAVLIIIYTISLFYFKNKSLNFIKILILLLLVIPTVLHFSIGMLYPKDRAAIYWMIILGFLVMFVTEAVLNHLRNVMNRAYTIILLPLISFSILQIINFIPNFNITHTIIWQYDSDVKNALQVIEQKKQKKSISLGASWFVEPELNYYRKTKKINWLQTVKKETPIVRQFDYYLIFEEDFASLNEHQLSKIVFFPNSGLYLMESKN